MTEHFKINEDGSIHRFGKIKSIDELTIEECNIILQDTVNYNANDIEKINKRYYYLLEEQKKLNPRFINRKDYFKLHPGYKNKHKSITLTFLLYASTMFLIFLCLSLSFPEVDVIIPITVFTGYAFMVSICMYIAILPFDKMLFEIEETESDVKITRAQSSNMGLFRFNDKKYKSCLPLAVANTCINVINYGGGTYLIITSNIDWNSKKVIISRGLINCLEKDIWIYPMQECDIYKTNDDIIVIENKNGVVKKMNTRGFVID